MMASEDAPPARLGQKVGLHHALDEGQGEEIRNRSPKVGKALLR